MKSKCSIVLPTDAEFVRVFETTLIEGFSCVNTRLAFDTDALVKDPKSEKVLIEIENENGQKQLKRFSSKIIKMDENNQYGQAMAKPLHTVVSKNKNMYLSFSQFNKILDLLNENDPIGHLFTVDIKFKDINEKTLLFNEIYPPIFEKNKKIDPFERSTVQIMSRAVKKDEKDEIESLPFNSKIHSTLKDKLFVTLYAEDIHFLVSRAGWLVTQIYAHYRFYQSKFKKDFVVINQKSCQAATSKVEKDFYKLLNNSNFGIDCRNNIDNCKLKLIYDGIDEIIYIKKITNLMGDYRYRDIFSPELMGEQIEREFDEKLKKLNREGPAYEAALEHFERKKDKDLDAVNSFEKKIK